ncbi:YkgJ family cysteine cluster protein [Desulfobacula sp.]|uniref:YkgJ family cysteine cluster protein n=1 Tax=Desulfobacula sp. TaxID=2593537 RepID=UPI0026252113|nr:YkgJ family cysteine cluster protein [Desulfobacula sp.]
MDENSLHLLLENYTALLKRVDGHIQHIEKKYAAAIVCKKGCDTCCKFLTIFPVEAFAISAAFIKLPKKIQAKVIQRLKNQDDACPLLIDKACVLYSARPIICRTHGYPIYMERGKKPLIDFCPQNFKGMTSFPKDALISIDPLNTLLIAVNRHFLDSIEATPPFPERIPMSNALFILNEID